MSEPQAHLNILYKHALARLGDTDFTLHLSKLVLHVLALDTLRGSLISSRLRSLALETILRINYDRLRDPLSHPVQIQQDQQVKLKLAYLAENKIYPYGFQSIDPAVMRQRMQNGNPMLCQRCEGGSVTAESNIDLFYGQDIYVLKSQI
jgi:hypothetical protein